MQTCAGDPTIPYCACASFAVGAVPIGDAAALERSNLGFLRIRLPRESCTKSAERTRVVGGMPLPPIVGGTNDGIKPRMFPSAAALLLSLAAISLVVDVWGFTRIVNEAPAILVSATDTRGTVVLASGNKAMNSFMRNWGESILRLQDPPLFFFLALDKAGYADLKADGKWKILPDPAAWALFGPERSGYREAGYNLMSAYKWEKVLELLGGGRHVLMSDPDIVFLRNPVPYLYTLPACDVYPMVDLSTGFGAREVREKGGFTVRGYMNYYNGGFAYFRSTPTMISALQFFRQYMNDQRSAGNVQEEQTYFNSMLANEYTFVKAAGVSDGEAVVSAISEGRCLQYAQKGSPSNILSVYPLNQALFPNHPVFSRHQFHMTILERPFIVHYNWLVTSVEKKNAMRADGNWLIDEQASVPD